MGCSPHLQVQSFAFSRRFIHAIDTGGMGIDDAGIHNLLSGTLFQLTGGPKRDKGVCQCVAKLEHCRYGRSTIGCIKAEAKHYKARKLLTRLY